MKTMSRARASNYVVRTGSVSPAGRVRKVNSEERKEKIKVEETLKRLVGSEENVDQLELVLQVINYIRQLQSQLHSDKENSLPEDVNTMLTQMVAHDKE